MDGLNSLLENSLQEVRQVLALHGGDLDFVKFEQGILYVRLKGACDGCPLAPLTIKAGIEEILIKKIPGLKKVETIETINN